MPFQESKTRTLITDIPKIVKSIKSSADDLKQKIIEAEHQAELRRQEQAAQRERWLLEDDQRKIAQSIKESHPQLDEVIQLWASVISIEQFFKSVEERACELPDDLHEAVIERLRFAREFIGTLDRLDYFCSWMTPSERYRPLAERTPNESSNENSC